MTLLLHKTFNRPFRCKFHAPDHCLLQRTIATLFPYALNSPVKLQHWPNRENSQIFADLERFYHCRWTLHRQDPARAVQGYTGRLAGLQLVIAPDIDHLPGKVDHRADDESHDRHRDDQPAQGPVPRGSVCDLPPERLQAVRQAEERHHADAKTADGHKPNAGHKSC